MSIPRDRHFQMALVVSAILLALSALIVRLYAGPVLAVKYDLLMSSSGEGYAPTALAISAKLLFGILAVSAAWYGVQHRRRRLLWLALFVCSVAGFLSIGQPGDKDRNRAVERGQELVASIEAFHAEHGMYPSSLKEITDLPHTGLAAQRRFYYASRASSEDDRADHWFAGAKSFLGKADYVICIPLVPGGTIIYRSDRDYSDLPGRKMKDGWFATSRD
jgi:hypothetical protein